MAYNRHRHNHSTTLVQSDSRMREGLHLVITRTAHSDSRSFDNDSGSRAGDAVILHTAIGGALGATDVCIGDSMNSAAYILLWRPEP